MAKRGKRRKRGLPQVRQQIVRGVAPTRHVWVRVTDREWDAFRALCTSRDVPAGVVLGLLIDRYVRTGGKL